MLGNLGKYRLDARLGGGGMAEVFVGSTIGAEGFSRRVAIKRVLPGYSENPAFAQMFVAEAKISSRLVHPNVVSVLDFDRDAEGRLFLVMELVEGQDLDALTSSGPLPMPVVIFVISEVLRGLGHAHDLPIRLDDIALNAAVPQTITRTMRGIVHRDVSPHNVLLSWDGAVKVSDFGIAKARSASNATASVFIKGKPAYMSPEQANGEALDGRSDLFAVGVMLWELLLGRRLFVAEDTRGTLAAVLFGQIPRPRAIRADVPKDLERVAMKLLERDLKSRYGTAEEAIHDLLECVTAPKHGRELLAKTLAERFPQRAPVRQSVLRSRGQDRSAPNPAPHLPTQDRPTVADGAADRRPSPIPAAAPALPSLGAVMNAPTGTIEPMASIRPRKQRTRTIALLAGTIASAALAFGIVMAVTSSHGRGPGSGSGATTDAGSQLAATVSHPTVLDAGVPDAAPPPPLIDASTIDAAFAPQKDASVPQSGHSGADNRFGRLAVHAFPALTVYIDRKKVHDTPIDMALPVGKHSLRLVNSEFGRDETLAVTITENHTTSIERE